MIMAMSSEGVSIKCTEVSTAVFTQVPHTHTDTHAHTHAYASFA